MKKFSREIEIFGRVNKCNFRKLLKVISGCNYRIIELNSKKLKLGSSFCLVFNCGSNKFFSF